MSSPISNVRRALSKFSATTLVLHIALGAVIAGLPVFSTPTFAATTLLTDTFGTGANDNDIDDWDENGSDSGATTLSQDSAASGDESFSPADGSDTGRFASIAGTDWICRQVDASGYENLVLKYYWRGDTDAEDSEAGIAEYATGGSCSSPTGLTMIASHELDDGDNGVHEAWSSQQSVSLPASLDDDTFFLRFRSTGNSSNESFRVDAVLVEGDETAPTCNSLDATVWVNSGNVIVGGPDDGDAFSGTLNGTVGNDVIVLPSVGTVNGLGGDDTVCGTSGNDTITTTGGNDWIDAGAGGNSVSAGEGNNTIDVGSGNDTVTAGSGNDTVDDGGGTNSINVGEGTNNVTSGDGNDTITTGSGDDDIDAGDGTNVINVGDGDNDVTSGTGNDTITTGSGDDNINASSGTNNITSGAGHDHITSGSGNDTVNAGDGNDEITVGSGTNNVNAGNGNDTIDGDSGNDTFDGGAGTDVCDPDGGTNSVTNCESTDSSDGVITIEKDTTPDSSGTSFDFTGDLGSFSINGESSQAFIVDGEGEDYDVIESIEAGWTLDSITCNDGGSSVNLGTRTATIDMDDNESITCVFTNSTSGGTIVIVKDAVPDDAQNFTFTSDIPSNTTFDLDDDADGTLSNTKTMSAVAAGTYSVSETVPTGWTQTSATCSDGSPVSAIDLSSGETVTCTFTNTKLGTVTVVKNALPDDNQSFDFTSTLPSGSNFSLTDAEGGEDGSTVFTSVPLGGYTITEGEDPTNWNLTSISCTGGNADYSTDLGTRTATIDVDAGENITCTFTNTKNGTITVYKNAYGDDGVFDIDIDGEGSSYHDDESIETSDGEGSAVFSVPPGDYNISETLPDATWQTEYNGCSFVTVGAGGEVSCTIRNVKKSTIEFRKQTTDGVGTFSFHGTLDGSDSQLSGEDGFDVTTTDGESAVNPASSFFDVFVDSEGSTVNFSEGQSSSDGWTLTGKQCTINDATMGEGEGASYSFNLDPGQTAVCTFTNDKAVCGNSDIEEAEQCDDGNVTSSDGCSSTCQYEPGWSCGGEPSECAANCGDGNQVGPEQCDDSNIIDGDGCTSSCQLEVCGDGQINNANEEDELSDEVCDDSNASDGDGCSSTCQIETGFTCPVEGAACGGICGDGLIRGAEECDDGEGEGPGCDSSCEVEENYACAGEPSVCSQDLDYGDAPEGTNVGVSYPTTVSNDGARHLVTEGVYLGAGVDVETDGQPDGNATGDDLAGTDDEDGVEVGTLQSGSTDSVTITASVIGTIDGWVDFNRDGDWSDDGEHILDTVPVAAGVSGKSVVIPASVPSGDTFARFRFRTSSESLGVTGLASDGEVEDYKVTVVAGESTGSSESSSSSATGDDGGGNGGQSGSDSRRIFSSILSIANGEGLTQGPQPGFGGTADIPLSSSEMAFLKTVALILHCDVSDAFFRMTAELLGPIMGRDADVIFSGLKAICAESSAQRGTSTVVLVPPRPVVMNENGYPVSSNLVWNLCVQGKATLADIRSNTDVFVDRDTGKTIHYSCDHYRMTNSNTWKYPDDPYLLITVLPARVSGVQPTVSVSKGYAVVYPDAPQTTTAAK